MSNQSQFDGASNKLRILPSTKTGSHRLSCPNIRTMSPKHNSAEPCAIHPDVSLGRNQFLTLFTFPANVRRPFRFQGRLPPIDPCLPRKDTLHSRSTAWCTHCRLLKHPRLRL